MKVLELHNIKIPSINNKYNKNFSLTREYRAFKDMLLHSLKRAVLIGPYAVHVLYSGYIDIDNPIKAILDALETKGIIDNDKYILSLRVNKAPLKRGQAGSLIVHVEHFSTEDICEGHGHEHDTIFCSD